MGGTNLETQHSRDWVSRNKVQGHLGYKARPWIRVGNDVCEKTHPYMLCTHINTH